MLKINRVNGMLYKKEALHKISSDLGMNFRTFKKYFDKCVSLGFIKHQGTHFQAASYSQLIKIWEDPFLNTEDHTLQDRKQQFFLRHLYVFNKTSYKKRPTFKDVYNQIIDSVIIKNFKQQEYKINQEKEKISVYKRTKTSRLGSNKGDNRKQLTALKALAKDAAKAKMSTDDYVKSMSGRDNYIKTGKTHISKLIGMSASTGKRRLKSLEESKKIKRERIVENTNLPGLHECFDVLRSESNHFIIQGKKLHLSKGSKIGLKTNYIRKKYSVKGVSSVYNTKANTY